MRTDSVNLSKEAIEGCKKYIVKTYGENYHKQRSYIKNGKNAQEAHEAIRPTNISVDYFDKIGDDGKKLYNLIWKRTVASQMSDAIIKIQTIKVDILDNDKSILPKSSFYSNNFETILFDGYLVLYNNKTDSEDDNENGLVDIKENIELKFESVKVTGEYTKPPLRYNEPNLIKTLEKNGIGRPSFSIN